MIDQRIPGVILSFGMAVLWLGCPSSSEPENDGGLKPPVDQPPKDTPIGKDAGVENDAGNFRAGDGGVKRDAGNGAALDDGGLPQGENRSVDWCIFQWPHHAALTLGLATEAFYGRVFLLGVTGEGSEDHFILGEIGLGQEGSDPSTHPSWTWQAGSFARVIANESGEINDDEYEAQLTIDQIGNFDAAWRFSADEGASWTTCDIDGSDNGYQADQAATIVVTAPEAPFDGGDHSGSADAGHDPPPADAGSTTDILSEDGGLGIGSFDAGSSSMTWARRVYEGNGWNGFGGAVGKGSLEISADEDEVNFLFHRREGDFSDLLVLYIDTQPQSGFSDTASMNDQADLHRAAISGAAGGSEGLNALYRSTVVFPDDLLPEMALAIDANYAGLWRLENGGDQSLAFIESADLVPTGRVDAESYTFSVTWAALGFDHLAEKSFGFVGTYLNAINAFRSNEVFGESDVSEDNMGYDALTFHGVMTYDPT